MHISRYPSFSQSKRDLTYSSWWRALGATGFENVAPVSGAVRPITDDQLLRSLQFVLSIPNASFREGQLEACRHVANSSTENALVGLDCGAGKSTTFTVPLYAKWRYRKINGVTIVICPHRIALKQHYETATKELQSTDISIGILSAGDIDDELTVVEIEKFDLLFLSLDGWCRITTDKLKGILLDLRRKRGVDHVIFDEYHMLYDETSIREKTYLSSRHLLATGATITILTATLPNPFRRPVMQFLDIEDSAIEIGMGKCGRPDIEVNVYDVERNMLDDSAAKRISARLRSHPDGTVHCIAYFKEDAKTISVTLQEGYNITNTLLTADSDVKVCDEVAKNHRAGKIKVLVSTFGTALDGPKVDYVCIAGGAWSMNSLVQNFGRIRKPSQGRNAVVDILYVSLEQEFWSKLVADANRNAIKLKNEKNGLVVSVADYREHCSVVGVKNFIQMKGCRLVNAYRRYGGTEESCGRCDNCRGGCAHTAASNRRYRALIEANADRLKYRRFVNALEAGCVICNRQECDGQNETKCNNTRHSCYLCGWQGDFRMHQRENCTAKEFQYVPNGYCRFCLVGIKDDTGGVDVHGGFDKCKMKKRLHRFFRYCFRIKYGNPNDNGESYMSNS